MNLNQQVRPFLQRGGVDKTCNSHGFQKKITSVPLSKLRLLVIYGAK